MLSKLTPEQVKAKKQENIIRLKSILSGWHGQNPRWLAAIPQIFVFGHLKALAGESSPRGAIKAKCCDCVGWEDVSNNVGGCKAISCPLWKYRPYQDKVKP